VTLRNDLVVHAPVGGVGKDGNSSCSVGTHMTVPSAKKTRRRVWEKNPERVLGFDNDYLTCIGCDHRRHAF